MSQITFSGETISKIINENLFWILIIIAGIWVTYWLIKNKKEIEGRFGV